MQPESQSISIRNFISWNFLKSPYKIAPQILLTPQETTKKKE